MTAPTERRGQVARVATWCAIVMKYSSQLGRCCIRPYYDEVLLRTNGLSTIKRMRRRGGDDPLSKLRSSKCAYPIAAVANPVWTSPPPGRYAAPMGRVQPFARTRLHGLGRRVERQRSARERFSLHSKVFRRTNAEGVLAPSAQSHIRGLAASVFTGTSMFVPDVEAMPREGLGFCDIARALAIRAYARINWRAACSFANSSNNPGLRWRAPLESAGTGGRCQPSRLTPPS